MNSPTREVQTAALSNDISYCCVSMDTINTTDKIRTWIANRKSEGWRVEFSVRMDSSDRVGVMWQCVGRTDGKETYQEFTPCISMCGHEFLQN